MTTFQEKVKDISKEIYNSPGKWHQIIIDLIQDDIEDLLNPDAPLTSEAPAAASYRVHNLREIMAPAFAEEIGFLIRLENALDDWSEDMRANNNLLGVPPQS